MKNKGWKILQIIQLIIFLCFSAFLFARTVDGHGTVQTLEVKLISFAIWAAFYLGVLAIEWLIYVIVRRSKSKINICRFFCHKSGKFFTTQRFPTSVKLCFLTAISPDGA